MKRNAIPSYLRHGPRDQARACWTDRTGTRKFRLLPGRYDSPESREAYARLVLEIESGPSVATDDPSKLTIAELRKYPEARHSFSDRGPASLE